MHPTDLIENPNPEKTLSEIILSLHEDGPVKQEVLESLAYLKRFHPLAMNKEEPKLMYLLGLFYKVDKPKDSLSYVYSIFKDAIEEESKKILTPVQASIRNHIQEKKFFSFSAPTSIGKSHLFRELILEHDGDIVIVVPSRALVSEYLIKAKKVAADRKEILILQFVDDVNRRKSKRKVFVVTPERAMEVFKTPNKYGITLFLFDEAHASEDVGIRGITFDSLVRRAEKVFPGAKKIFAHPFITNPEAQFRKHDFVTDISFQTYKQNSVGKIFVSCNKREFEFFSPFVEGAHLKVNKRNLEMDIVKDVIEKNGSVLIYISKNSIYKQTIYSEFSDYISLCNDVRDPQALEIIEEIKVQIGASSIRSSMVELMKKGIVIHHGSIPLSVRYLIEKFTNLKFSKICFATSTLAQGINMPFDLVWIHNGRFHGSDENQTIGLKNLIGRAGRNTQSSNNFDFGYVVVNNIKTFVEKFSGETKISDVSILDRPLDGTTQDLAEILESIRNNTMNEEYSLPGTRLERIQTEEAHQYILDILDGIFSGNETITGNNYQKLPKVAKDKIKNAFKGIYRLYLGRPLVRGEEAILSTSIMILLWQIQGKSFSELVGFRFSYLSKRDERRVLARRLERNEITQEDYDDELRNMTAHFSQAATLLPNKELSKSFSVYDLGTKVLDLNYDAVVYDTYDYLDKVISFSLSDIFCAAFGLYNKVASDGRAEGMVNYFRYGTSQGDEIWLLRYGFTFEDIEWLKGYIEKIDENEIVFKSTVDSLTEVQKKIIERYL